MVQIQALVSKYDPIQSKHASETAIIPIRPLVSLSSGRNGLSMGQQHQSAAVRVTFLQAFGMLGIPMFLIALGCVLWTLWLMCLTVAPNATANYLMNTAEFDNGTFWLIVDPDRTLMVVTLTGLSVIALAYVYILAKMTLLRNRTRRPSRIEVTASRIHSRVHSMAFPKPKWRQWFHRHWTEITSFHGHRRKYWNLLHMALDLLIQSLTLRQMLERGSPPTLIYAYTAMIAGNAAVYAVCVLLPNVFSAFAEMLIGSLFDLLFAVGFPIVMLAYSYSHFEFDRQVVLLNMAVFPKGNFQQGARLYTNPAEIALFRTVFDKLRVISVSDLFLSLGMDMSFAYRFIHVVSNLLQNQRQVLSQPSSTKRRLAVFQRAVPRAIALAVVTFSCLLVIAAHNAVTSSRRLCAPFSECAVYAFRWSIDSDPTTCPCITFIDRNPAPKTLEEWLDPVDVTEKVRQLAAAGTLRVIDIINRRLSSWPDEVRLCTNMQHISLFYTDIDYLPDWMRNFRKLEFLHIEGNSAATNLATMPHLFTAMHALTFIHLGLHVKLEDLPSFQGLSNVQALVLAILPSVQELPSFAPLTQLRRLELVGLPLLSKIPDLAACPHIVELNILGRSSMCCNGFLRTPCDLSHPYCTADTFNRAAPCMNATTDELASDATLNYMQRFASSVCQIEATDGPHSEPIVKSQVDYCDGVVFRQCPANAAGTSGICTNLRMQVLMCVHDPNTIAMRQQQIVRGIGTRCDPVEEAWLGCKS